MATFSTPLGTAVVGAKTAAAVTANSFKPWDTYFIRNTFNTTPVVILSAGGGTPITQGQEWPRGEQ